MLKVLIADDEMLVRVGVKSTIEWEKHGFTVVGEAYNGEDALEKITALSPDILLTDIRMPKMDGLELLREIRRRGLSVETVIMSCYNEFELVRTAMRLGASDYLLKLSLTPEELLEVLERVRQKIGQRPSADAPRLFDQSDVYDKLVRKLWEPDTPAGALNELAGAAGLRLAFEHAGLFLITVDPAFDQGSLSYPPMDGQTLSMAGNLLHDYLRGQKLGDIVTLESARRRFLAVLLPDADAWETARCLRRRLSDYLKLDVTVGIVEPGLYEAEGLSLFRERWEELMNYRFLQGRGGFFPFSGREASSPSVLPFGESLPVKTFIADIRGVADLGKLPPDIRRLAGQMADGRLPRKDCLQMLLSAFYQVSALFSLYGGNLTGLNEACGINFVESLSGLQFLSDAESWFAGFAQRAPAYLEQCGRQWKSPDIVKAVAFIQANFHRPVSLQDTAAHIGISAPYLSTLFRRETGQSFIEFLTDLRMERAKELLEDKNIYIYELGERVGYSDPNYFCKVFKSRTGMSPEAYRKSRAGGELADRTENLSPIKPGREHGQPIPHRFK